jgi:membrane protein YqaA with SNARE-associated domain
LVAKQTTRKSTRVRRIAIFILLITAMPTMLFGLRTYASFRLLRSAYEAGAPMTSSIRPWMTLKYVATTYRTTDAALVEQLGLPSETDPNTSLKTLADRAGVGTAAYTQRVQRVIAVLMPDVRSDRSKDDTGWLGAMGDQVLTALLVYGYPALGLTLLLGAIGLPLPDGVATTVAGSLASQGRIDWFWASAIVVTASVLGDAVGYGLGRLLSQNFLERHGRWFGLNAGECSLSSSPALLFPISARSQAWRLALAAIAC